MEVEGRISEKHERDWDNRSKEIELDIKIEEYEKGSKLKLGKVKLIQEDD